MDIMQREGRYPLPPGAPDTMGVEFSGTIEALGEGCVQKWKVGDEVIGLALGVSVSSICGFSNYTRLFVALSSQGAYAEYIRLPQTNVMAKPSHLTWV